MENGSVFPLEDRMDIKVDAYPARGGCSHFRNVWLCQHPFRACFESHVLHP